jgi:hypothetical protein
MKTMRSRAATTEKSRLRKACRGQVIAEYVVFLAVTLAFVAALVLLMRVVGEHSDRNVERIGYSVP